MIFLVVAVVRHSTNFVDVRAMKMLQNKLLYVLPYRGNCKEADFAGSFISLTNSSLQVVFKSVMIICTEKISFF